MTKTAPLTGLQARLEMPAALENEPAPWEGQRVRIEDLPAFKARWGLAPVGGEKWLGQEPGPIVYFMEG